MSKRKILKQQCKEIIQLNPTERVWQMPFFFALAVGFALSIAAYYDRMDLGLIAIIRNHGFCLYNQYTYVS